MWGLARGGAYATGVGHPKWPEMYHLPISGCFSERPPGGYREPPQPQRVDFVRAALGSTREG